MHLCIYMHLFFFKFFSHLGYYRILSRVSYALQWVLVGYLLYIYSSVYMSIPNSQFILSSHFPPLVTISLLNKRCLFLGGKAMTNLDSILKSRDITLPTKAHLAKAMVLPVVMYGCETWTVKKAERRRIDAFEQWCWR